MPHKHKRKRGEEEDKSQYVPHYLRCSSLFPSPGLQRLIVSVSLHSPSQNSDLLAL